MRLCVSGGVLKEDVGGGDQGGAGEEEEAAVDGGEAEAGGAPRPAQPGGRSEPKETLSCPSDAVAAVADGVDDRRVTELGAQPIDGGLDGRGERVGGRVPYPFEELLGRDRLALGRQQAFQDGELLGSQRQSVVRPGLRPGWPDRGSDRRSPSRPVWAAPGRRPSAWTRATISVKSNGLGR